MKSAKSLQKNVMGWAFSTPYLAFALVFFAIPLVWALWLSTMDWNLMSVNRTWVGLQNFVKALTNERILAASLNTLWYILVLVPTVLGTSTFIAFVLHKLPRKIKGIFSVSFFIPYLTSGVAISVFVRYFFSYSSVLNTFLREQMDLDIRWFQDPGWAFLIIVGLIVWKISGYYALIILASLESIPPEVHDAADVDGATGFQKFFRITIPMITNSYSTVVILLVGLVFGIFSEPFLLTGGGPNLATTTWYLELFNTSFVRFESGMGAAVAILNAIQVFIMIRIISSLMSRIDHNHRS